MQYTANLPYCDSSNIIIHTQQLIHIMLSFITRLSSITFRHRRVRESLGMRLNYTHTHTYIIYHTNTHLHIPTPHTLPSLTHRSVGHPTHPPLPHSQVCGSSHTPSPPSLTGLRVIPHTLPSLTHRSVGHPATEITGVSTQQLIELHL